MKTAQIIIITITLGANAPSVLYGQKPTIDSTKEKMNRISVQMGLFHYFFDNAPILNVNHREYNGKPRSGLFNQLLISSYGLQYDRKINKKNSLSVEAMIFANSYWGNRSSFPIYSYSTPRSRVADRIFTTININYSRILKLSKQFDFIFGGGVNYRNGYEGIIVLRTQSEYLIEGTLKNDFGLNAFIGIDYTPWKWLSIFTKIDFMGLVYLHDKENIKELRSYGNMPNYYPSRFDLSWRFGVGINF